MPFRRTLTKADLPVAIAYEDEANVFTLNQQVLALLVGGQQVVGARGAAVADVPAGGVGTAAGGWDTAVNRDAAITSINALLARLRTHGLIA